MVLELQRARGMEVVPAWRNGVARDGMVSGFPGSARHGSSRRRRASCWDIDAELPNAEGTSALPRSLEDGGGTPE